ncbi:MAG: beta-lactamase family protein [Saprospiraceae bacterium]|nr:beta-lactamase family protein [Saprospiraceae bacterium]
MQSTEQVLAAEVQKNRAPAVQYVFFNKDSVLYRYQAGYANLGDSLKFDHNTTFNMYSVTKTFTALAVMQLVAKGLVDLDKPVRQYLPGNTTLSGAITVRHLLTHTAGLPNPLPINWIHLPEAHPAFDRNAFFAPILAKYQKPKSEPGSAFRYTNLGYLLLGQVIESVSGMSYEDYIRQHILDRLSPEPGDLGFEIPHPLLHAKGYHRRRSLSMLLLGFLLDKSKYMDPAIGRWKPFKANYVNGAPYGGLIGTGNGLVKYGQALLRGDGNLIPESYKNLLFTENIHPNGKPSRMAMAWFKGRLKNQEYYMHAGGGGGYYCELRLYPGLGAGSFIVFNRSGFSNERFLDKVDRDFL